MKSKLRVIEPDWPAPDSILALCTTRTGGHSLPPYGSFNLAFQVGDDPAAVDANRVILVDALQNRYGIQWLEQVHGVNVVKAAIGDGKPCPKADATWSDEPGVACAVMIADCLPVLFCSADGQRVAAAHAGWRGLLAGVLESSVQALGRDPGDLMAWLGPAIGPEAFEVGREVREAFLDREATGGNVGAADCFQPSVRNNHYFADLYALARQRLRGMGLTQIYGGGFCTFKDSDRFFSYRRDGLTGRMAGLVMIRSPQDHT